ncbi:hypothetical protein [Poseidonocella sedimentorum]|uniref:Uncharacterized protein n=1 Tax=Poseidonocella sedimentorum TaxID=871652 RepID=A0A1I6DIB4_9RHOB|nr:hypothetical protein [Poseidonocella sedimentorum]SFR05138.1 hypothetical protein SAMN04515673_103311 [Poseidonocella sedimentorum]
MRHTETEKPEIAGLRAMLPSWMFWGGIAALIAAIVLVIIALSTGAEQTGIEESPFRNVPEPVLSPDG